ncbi:MAG: hypothetical protein JNN19_00925 [Bacteroidia bacterium]|nr:hypothetical protein [Bacteroidia bacterium]
MRLPVIGSYKVTFPARIIRYRSMCHRTDAPSHLWLLVPIRYACIRFLTVSIGRMLFKYITRRFRSKSLIDSTNHSLGSGGKAACGAFTARWGAFLARRVLAYGRSVGAPLSGKKLFPHEWQ